jgi:hypothetical protein
MTTFGNYNFAFQSAANKDAFDKEPRNTSLSWVATVRGALPDMIFM